MAEDLKGSIGEVQEEELKEEPERPKFKFIEIPRQSGDHPLQNSWVFSFVPMLGARGRENYEKNIETIAKFSSVEGFWKIYNHLVRPNDLPITSDYHLFKSHIKPLWEDESNKLGGKVMIRLRKGLGSKYWEDFVLLAIGEQLEVGNEICGIVISIRYQEDVISIWTKNAQDHETRTVLQEKVKEVVGYDPNISVEYKAHDASLKDYRSYQNKSIQGKSGENKTGDFSRASDQTQTRSERWGNEPSSQQRDSRRTNPP